MFDLTGKVALVTGASSGIGKAAALALAGQEAKVVVTARRIDRLTQLAEEIKVKGGEALPLQMDVTQRTQIEAAVSEIVQHFGRLDILVNNAGVYLPTPLGNASESDWDTVIATNLKAYFFISQLISREMEKNTWGRIINIGSVAMGSLGFGAPGGAAYTASKGGVAGLTESLAVELASKGILVNCIAPGLIESEMTKGVMENRDQFSGILSRIPLKRAGKPEEIAALVVYLASDEASYTTGSVFVVDGGWLAQ